MSISLSQSLLLLGKAVSSFVLTYLAFVYSPVSAEESAVTHYGDSDDFKFKEDSTVVSRKNWLEHSQYLFEPIAKLIDSSKIEIVETAPAMNASAILPIVPPKGISVASVTKYSITASGLYRHEANASLIWGSSLKEESNFSILFNKPDYVRDWLYSIKLTAESSQLSMFTHVNKCRTVHIENSSDEILAGPISVDDIMFPLLRGTKSYDFLYNESEVESKQMYVPSHFDQAEMFILDDVKMKELDLVIARLNSSDAKIDLGQKLVETATPKKKILFNSSQVRFGMKLSQVNIVERKAKSPYSDISYEILAVDVKTKLPLIKLMYGIKNNFLRGVFYYWDKVKNNTTEYYIPNALISFDRQGSNFVELQRILTAESFNENLVEDKRKILCGDQGVKK